MSQVNHRRKLVFHIGHHKTGTTTIQDAFATGRVHISGKRVLYPAHMAHNYLVGEFQRYTETGQVRDALDNGLSLPEISTLLESEDFDYALFSGESFEGFHPKSFKKVLRAFMLPHARDHAIVCYVRPHAARTLSSFAEQTKIGSFGGSLMEFHQHMSKRDRLFFGPRLASWQVQFAEHFRARPMVRDALKGGSLLDDFIDTGFDTDLEVSVEPGTPANVSLSVEDLALLRHLQSRLNKLDRPTRHAIGWAFFLNCAQRRSEEPSTKLALDKRTAERIRRTYIEDAKSLDAGIFAATPVMERELDRAVDTAIPAPQSLEISDHFSPDTIRALDLYADMTIATLDKDRKRLRKRLHHERIVRLHGGEPAPLANGKPTSPITPNDPSRRLNGGVIGKLKRLLGT